MLRIKYPTDPLIINKIKSDFIDSLSLSKQTRDKYLTFRDLLDNPIIPKTLDELLVLNFEDLSNCCFLQQELKESDKKKMLEEIFDYRTYQNKISDFFMTHKDLISINTCYYCNIDYINAYNDLGDYHDSLDFVKRADYKDYLKIYKIGPKGAKNIESQRSAIKKIQDLKFLNKTQMINLTNLTLNNKFNHFTIDHVLAKDDHPIAALCLYNFVPSCYVCNCKLKNKTAIVKNEEKYYLSPTSQKFSVEDDIKIDILFPLIKNWKGVRSNTDFLLEFNFKYDLAGYTNYLDVFKLKGRYIFHKKMALSMIIKTQKYSLTQISEFAKITGGSIERIKSDIFGSEVFEGNCENLPFTKFKREIARNIDFFY